MLHVSHVHSNVMMQTFSLKHLRSQAASGWLHRTQEWGMQPADLLEREALKLRSLNHSQSEALFKYSATPSLIQWDTSSFQHQKQSTSKVATVKFFIRKQKQPSSNQKIFFLAIGLGTCGVKRNSFLVKVSVCCPKSWLFLPLPFFFFFFLQQ